MSFLRQFGTINEKREGLQVQSEMFPATFTGDKMFMAALLQPEQKKGAGFMRCGSKCFLVEMEVNGEKQVKPVTARTPVDARKTIRLEYGAEAQILSVREEKKR